MVKDNIDIFGAKNDEDLLRALDSRITSCKTKRTYREWYDGHVANNDLYLGRSDEAFNTKQYDKIVAMEAAPAAANMTAPLVDVLCGVEIEGRFRMKATADSVDPEATELADAMTSYLRKVQIAEEGDKAFAAAFKDSLIGGLGWVEVCYEDKQAKIKRVDPLTVIWDARELPERMSDIGFLIVCRKIDKRKLFKRFGRKVLKLNFSEDLTDDLFYNGVKNMASLDGASEACADTLLEYYYLRAEYGYDCETRYGFHFKTLDKEAALKIAGKKGKIEERIFDVPYRACVCQRTVLENKKLDYVPLDCGLPIFPIMYNCERKPHAFVTKLRPLQQEMNYAITVREALATSFRTVLKTQNVALRKKVEESPGLITNMNAIIPIGLDEDVRFFEHSQGIGAASQTIQLYMELFKKVSGIEDESRGIQTNATSGVAQQMRERMSMRTNAYLFESLVDLKKRVGNFIVNILQNTMDRDILVNMCDQEERRSFLMNWLVEDEQGNKVIKNKIFGRKFFVSIEETPIFARGNDAAKRGLDEIAKLPEGIAQLVLNNEDLLGMFVENPKRVLSKLRESRINEARLATRLQLEAAQAQQEMQAQAQQQQMSGQQMSGQQMSEGDMAALRANPTEAMKTEAPLQR